MAADDEGGTPPAGGAGGSILTRKTGPLANWMWMAIILLVALVYSMWKRNKSAVAETEDGPNPEDVPGDQTPPPVFILPQNPQPIINITNPMTPATPPSAPPAAVKPAPATPPPKPGPPSKVPTVAYDTVTVAKYTSKNPVWNSTLWGIAKNKGYGAAKTNWKAIWDDPKNASLKKKRADPTKIQPGDVVYVRRK